MFIVVDCVYISVNCVCALNIIVGNKKLPCSHCVSDHLRVICMLPRSQTLTRTGNSQPCARTSRLSPTRLWPLCVLSFPYVSPSFVYIPVMWFTCGYSHWSPCVFIGTPPSFLPVTWIADAVVQERWIASFSRHLQVRAMHACCLKLYSKHTDGRMVGISEGVRFAMCLVLLRNGFLWSQMVLSWNIFDDTKVIFDPRLGKHVCRFRLILVAVRQDFPIASLSFDVTLAWRDKHLKLRLKYLRWRHVCKTWLHVQIQKCYVIWWPSFVIWLSVLRRRA